MTRRANYISFMSDTKWLKVLRALSTVEREIDHLEWKFVDESRVYRTPIPGAQDLAATRLKDGRFQPFEYRDVEWLDVITNTPPAVREQLASCGKRLIESLPTGLRIVGYRKEPN